MSNGFNIQNYTMIEAHVCKIFKAKKHKYKSFSFSWLLLSTLFFMDDAEINESITDTAYVGNHVGFDRGIDAIVINEDNDNREIHFFNIKYAETSEKSKNNNYPSNEIDKISSAIEDLFRLNNEGFKNCNPVLKDKVNEVIRIIQGDPSEYQCFVHFSSNHFKGLVDDEYKRVNSRLSLFRNLKIIQDSLDSISAAILGKTRVVVDGKIQYSQNDGFIRTDGNSRALIFTINAVNLLGIVADSEEIRNNPNFDDLNLLKETGIIEDAFDMNIRKYQKKRNRININIKQTALSDERQKIFYYNNGVTIICNKFIYGDTQNTVLTIENLQIVNGCQTVHSLFDSLKADPDKLKNVDVLCRLYEINNQVTYAKIAEYTNSQTPVTGRDLRSNDEVQRKLESEFNALGYIYERKFIQHSPTDDLSRVIDSEKAGQMLMAYNNGMPAEAKNRKSLVFGKEYENIFTDSLTASTLLDITKIFKKIENKKTLIENKMKKDDNLYEKKQFIIYASYYILYTLSIIKSQYKLSTSDLLNNFNYYYKKAISAIQKYVNSQKIKLGERYSASYIFKNQDLKRFIINCENSLFKVKS